MDRMTTDWKEFQDLVGRIETIASRHDATVKSPDHVADLVTGSLREVDASIRQRVGSAEVLITVECRKHKSVQDVTWIEQLATKRSNIGAALTIAVSASGFSEEASALAKRQGIALRTVSELHDDELGDMLSSVEILKPTVDILAFAIFLDRSEQAIGPDHLSPALKALLDSDRSDALIFRHVSRRQKASLNDLLRLAIDAIGSRAYDGVPHNHGSKKKTVFAETPNGDIYIDDVEFPVPVSKVVMSIEIRIQTEIILPDISVLYAGIAKAGAIKHAEFDIPDKDGSIRLHYQHDDDTSLPSMGVQIRHSDGTLHPAKLELVRAFSKEGKPIDIKDASEGVRIVDL